MSLFGIVIVALLSVVALVALVADVRAERSDEPALSPLERALGYVLGFFGIGGLPPMLALFVLASTAAIAAAALDVLAGLHLGTRYPGWFPAQALASGLGVGLLCTRLLAPPARPAQDMSYM